MFWVHNPGYKKNKKTTTLKYIFFKRNLTKQIRKSVLAALQADCKQQYWSREAVSIAYSFAFARPTCAMLVGETAIISSKAHGRSSWRSKPRRLIFSEISVRQDFFFFQFNRWILCKLYTKHFYKYNLLLCPIQMIPVSLGPNPTFSKVRYPLFFDCLLVGNPCFLNSMSNSMTLQCSSWPLMKQLPRLRRVQMDSVHDPLDLLGLLWQWSWYSGEALKPVQKETNCSVTQRLLNNQSQYRLSFVMWRAARRLLFRCA